MKQLFIIKTNSVKNGCSLSIQRFPVVPGIKKRQLNTIVFAKNLFLSACFFWDSGLFLGEMDQNLKFGGLIGYGNSCLDSVFRYTKAFRLHAILHDAAGAVQSHGGKGPGYCCVIRRELSSCLLGHATGLLCCL